LVPLLNDLTILSTSTKGIDIFGEMQSFIKIKVALFDFGYIFGESFEPSFEREFFSDPVKWG